MINLISAIATSAYIACTNCSGVGSVDLVCPYCNGNGRVKVVYTSRKKYNGYNLLDQYKPCPKCSKGLIAKDSKGSGKIRRWCPVCKGQKKIKKPVAISPDK